MIEHLAILAPGLLGGSVAMAARARHAAKRITLWARRPETRGELCSQSFADAVAETPTDAVRDASLVVIAAPVEKIIALAAQIAPALREGALVTDVGSVKKQICHQCTAVMPARAEFIGSHPMAGGSLTGWQNGSAELFVNRTTFITPHAHVRSQENIQTLSAFWTKLGARTAILSPEEHDEIVAHISHLPQSIATTLSVALSHKNTQWRAFAGNGLRDTTRIAASDAAMWIEILQQNRSEILGALDAYQHELAAFRTALDSQNWTSLRESLEKGKKFRDSLPT